MTDTPRTFDWKPRHDPRSLAYTFAPPVKLAPVTRLWKQGTVLDQGSEGACVGFGWTNMELNGPFPRVPQYTTAQGESVALERYNEAKKIDEYPGEDYSGTSVLAGAKVMQQAGVITSYYWATDIEGLQQAVQLHGPVVIGIPWYDNMYEAPGGRVTIGGTLVGGHCILVNGFSPSCMFNGKRGYGFRWRNSWGHTYGINGSAWIRKEDLAVLISQQGEMCVPSRNVITNNTKG